MFRIVAGIPLLQPAGHPAEWVHPIYEILFGRDALRVVQRAMKSGREHFFENLSAHIRTALGRKGIYKAVEQYASKPQSQKYQSLLAIPRDKGASPVPGISQSQFARAVQRIRPEWGKKHLSYLRSCMGATYWPEFVREVCKSTPEILLELGCGAGTATQAVVDGYPSFQRLLTIDIDFMCAKVAEGLFHYQGFLHRVDPIVGSFWFLPVRTSSVNAVFCVGSLSESREIDRAMEEVAKVLCSGGRFIDVERAKPMPNWILSLFAELGFSENEMRALASRAGLYAGPENLCKIAVSKGLEPVLTQTVTTAGRENALFVFEKPARG
jgi:ubiquinone/menaquinone biosynthesis C-methylase UbiE